MPLTNPRIAIIDSAEFSKKKNIWETKSFSEKKTKAKKRKIWGNHEPKLCYFWSSSSVRPSWSSKNFCTLHSPNSRAR